MTAKHPSEHSFEEQIQRWAAADDTGEAGDLILSTDDIRDWVQENIAQIGNFTVDPDDLPISAEERQNVFFGEEDLLRHWIDSGLIYWDDNDEIVTNSMLYILLEEQDDGTLFYTVYVDYEE